jgi:hypothetical protein
VHYYSSGGFFFFSFCLCVSALLHIVKKSQLRWFHGQRSEIRISYNLTIQFKLLFISRRLFFEEEDTIQVTQQSTMNIII